MKASNLLFILFIASLLACSSSEKALWKNYQVEKISSGHTFTEGPVWLKGQGLLFSDIPENRIMLLNLQGDTSTYLQGSGQSNGLGFNARGELVLCQHQARQLGVLRAGKIETLIADYQGKCFNSPNDLTFGSEGSIYFTDPDFGLNDNGATQEIPFCGIYRLAPDGTVYLLDSTLIRPNGIALSADEKKLFVDDTESGEVYVWDVLPDKTIQNKQLFFASGAWGGDGMVFDATGNLYVTSAAFIYVLSPTGEQLAKLKLTEGSPTNVAWEPGQVGEVLYVTARDAVYRISLKK